MLFKNCFWSKKGFPKKNCALFFGGEGGGGGGVEALIDCCCMMLIDALEGCSKTPIQIGLF